MEASRIWAVGRRIRAVLRFFGYSAAPTPHKIGAMTQQSLAHAAGWDAGNRSMRRAGRSRWNAEDYNAAVREYDRLMGPPPGALLTDPADRRASAPGLSEPASG